MKILCYGDSNTYGWDPTFEKSDRYDDKDIWTEILKTKGIMTINEGVPGRCLPQNSYDYALVNRMLEKYLDIDLVIVMLGTNDILVNPSLSEEKLLKRIENMFINTNLNQHRVLLVSPPPLSKGLRMMYQNAYDLSLRWSSLYQKAAEKYGCNYMDAGVLPLAFDGVHLSVKGHHILAEKLITCGLFM